jgi:hypothetical protein
MRRLYALVPAALLCLSACTPGMSAGLNHGASAQPMAPGDSSVGYIIGQVLGYVASAAMSYGAAYLIHGNKTPTPGA